MLFRSGEAKLLYTTGEITPGLDPWSWDGIVNRLAHLVLPSLVLIVGSIAFYSRYQRSAMLDVLGSDFLRTARAKGLRRSHALIRHGLRTALIPMVTFFAYQFALLFVGATFTEKIFGWHGMGEYFVDSVTKNDVNSVAAVTLFVAVLVLIAGFIALIYVAPYRMERMRGFMDPWSDEYGKGYQLSHSLIAFGRGEWFGVGLGGSVEKLFYLQIGRAHV